ncbi:MAG: hypothetical protein IJD68_00055 [Ruminococcus sp.]|nr:hypothetical protein [Ruminococcus sp.]
MKQKTKGRLKAHIKSKSKINLILSIIVALVLVARFLRADYYSVFLCVLTLLLFNIPLFVNKRLHVTLPKELEAVILLFIFSAEILGEIGSFYTHIPWWDTMLHTINGFLMAAIGFALIDILNNSPKFHFNMSPIFVAFVAFCFSMTVGVVWEFFEFSMDYFTLTDMQKDRLVPAISSVLLNPTGLNDEIVIKGIESTTVQLADGSTYLIEGGYLDIGIIDTMKDLLVNLIGAVVFSIIGYFYIIGRNKGVFAKKFIPQLQEKKQPSDKQDPTEKTILE